MAGARMYAHPGRGIRGGGGQDLEGLGEDVPAGPVEKNLPCNAGDSGSIPGPGTKKDFHMLQSNRAHMLPTRESAHHSERSRTQLRPYVVRLIKKGNLEGLSGPPREGGF